MKSIREMLGQLSLFARLQTAFANHIEEAEERLDKVEERLGKLETAHGVTHTTVNNVKMTLGDHLRNHP